MAELTSSGRGSVEDEWAETGQGLGSDHREGVSTDSFRSEHCWGRALPGSEGSPWVGVASQWDG